MVLNRGFVSLVMICAVGCFGAPLQAAVNLAGTYNDAGSGGNYTNASSIPVSSTDLINGLAPIDTNYVGTYEAFGGTTAPMTDGSTGLGNDDPSNNTNVLFDLGGGPQPWYLTYQLPGGGSYNIFSISVTTGHQDSRVNQSYDILVSQDNVLYTSLSGGAGFQYNPSGGNGGAAQSVLTDSLGGLLADHISYVQFQDLSGGNDVYRELDVQGQATPEPATLAIWGLGAFGFAAVGMVRRRNKKAS